MYNRVEQIRTINMPQTMTAKFLTIKERNYEYARGKGWNEPCNAELNIPI